MPPDRSESQSPIELHPVGRVVSSLEDLDDAPRQGDEGAPEAWIEFDPEVAAAAAHIERGEHLVLLTWLDRGDRQVLQVHPRGDPERPLTGVFSTR